MHVSTETIATIISAAALLLSFFVAFFGGFSWLIRRTDAQLGEVKQEVSGLRHDLGEVKHELGEVKIAIARIEGPPRHLLRAR
ncbi:MAG: hypothetical protein QM626_12370 [Microbacterium sp.]|uniref:hypothetical protein n=1 Tax=Microbacterium sp. TaxID=51671 RepID=UPI0039E5FD56